MLRNNSQHNDIQLEYYQVSETTLDEKVLARELAPLRKINDNHAGAGVTKNRQKRVKKHENNHFSGKENECGYRYILL